MNAVSIVSATELERETGLGKDLLRKWRSRYGFPVPLSAVAGELGYPAEQVAQLRLIRRLLNSGFLPKQVVGKPRDELEQLVRAIGACGEKSSAPPFIRDALELLKQHDLGGLDQLLLQARKRQGLSEFISQTVAPLVVRLGDAWAKGEIEVYHEHMCTSILTRRLSAEIGALTPRAGYPRILLATPSDELHVLGLLMAHSVLADQGADCISLGPHVPLGELNMAACGCRADIVALSFSFAYPKWRIRPMLLHLREILPAKTRIWAGGAGAAVIRRAPPGISLFSDLPAAVLALQHLVGNSVQSP